VTNTSVPQPNKEPYYPPTRQDYRDLIEHHYLIRAFTFFPLIIVAVSMYMAADYGPLHFLTGVAMNVGVLATCLTVPLAIPVMIRDAREARERGVDKAIPRRRLWKVAGRVAISLAFGAISIAYLTPFVRDATDGSRHVTVTTCTNTASSSEWVFIVAFPRKVFCNYCCFHYKASGYNNAFSTQIFERPT